MNHYKQIIKHTTFYSGTAILGRAVGFIMLPFYAHGLSAEGYGIVGMIDTMIIFLTIFAGFGFTGAIKRLYFEKADEMDRNRLISTSIIFMAGLLFVTCSPIILCSKLVSHIVFGNSEFYLYIILAVVTFSFQMITKIAESYALILKKPLLIGLVSLAALFVGLFLNIYLIVFLEYGVLGYLVSGLVVSFLTGSVYVFISFEKVGFSFKSKDIKGLLGFTLPMLPGWMILVVENSIDRYLLRLFLGLSAVGAYEMLFKFATLIGIIILEPFMKIWGVKRFELCDKINGPIFLADMFYLFLTFVLIFSSFLIVEVPLLIKVLCPSEFWLPGYIVAFAVISRMLASCSSHFNFGIFYSKKTQYISWIRLFTGLFHIIFSLIFIKLYGLHGIVFVGMLVTFFEAVLSFYFGQKLYFVPYNWRKIALIVLFVCVATLGSIWLSDLTFSKYNSYFQEFSGIIVDTIHIFGLGKFKDGVIITYLINNLDFVFIGFLRFLFLLIFVVLGLTLNIVPGFDHINSFFRRLVFKLRIFLLNKD